jgi:hydrogenase maturation factor
MIGRVIDVQENFVIVEYGTQCISAKTDGCDIRVGDWAIVESGFILEVISEAEALKLMRSENHEEVEDEDWI